MTLPLERSFEMQNENPKSGKLAVILLVILVVSIFINMILLYPKDLDVTPGIIITSLFIAPIMGIVGIVIVVVIQYFFVRIAGVLSGKKEIENGIFSGVILRQIFLAIYNFVIGILQIITIGDPTLTSLKIDSLGILDESNLFLNSFSLTLLISTYLMFLLLRGTAKLSTKHALLWSIVYFVLIFLIDLGSLYLLNNFGTPLEF